jgi:hypothetical protein
MLIKKTFFCSYFNSTMKNYRYFRSRSEITKQKFLDVFLFAHGTLHWVTWCPILLHRVDMKFLILVTDSGIVTGRIINLLWIPHPWDGNSQLSTGNNSSGGCLVHELVIPSRIINLLWIPHPFSCGYSSSMSTFYSDFHICNNLSLSSGSPR